MVNGFKMNKKSIKTLDKTLQIIMPDDYYSYMRGAIIPLIIKWHNDEIEKLNIKQNVKKNS